MSKKRVFSGTITANKQKCENCDNKDKCTHNDQIITAFSILLDCEGFYYVFRKLEKLDEKPKLCSDVEKLKKEMEEYEKAHENIPFLSPPLVTNGALALELAMKFLIFKENKEFECGHNLEVLFSQIPDVHSKLLKEKIYKEAHQNEETFNANIKNIANLFMDYRYFFEHESVGYSNFFTDLVHIVCDYALSMKEDLSNRIDEMD